jgi:hypothetical protein
MPIYAKAPRALVRNPRGAVAPEIDAASRMRTLEATPLDAETIVEQGLVGRSSACS